MTAERTDNPSNLPAEEQLCPRCDYSVFGLPQNRCPECGSEFTWEEVWAAIKRRTGCLFEYRWVDRPVSALWWTWRRAAFRPFRLWETYHNDDRPRVVPLLILLALQCLVFARGWHTVALAIDPAMNGLGKLVGGPASQLRFTYAFPMPTSGLRSLAYCSLAVFGALHIFFESKQRAGVGWRKVLRVFVHSTMFAALCPAIMCVCEGLLDCTYFFLPAGQRVPPVVYFRLHQYGFWCAWFVTWVCLWIGYRKHLRMPHGWAIAAVSMFVGWVAVRTATVWL